MAYTAKQHYTAEELDDAALRDLLNDARCAEEQAETGPFYPNATREGLLAYAAKCRSQAAKYANGGAHKAVSQS